MKKLLIFLVLIFCILLGYFLYDHFSYTNILVKFDKLEPFEKQMNVYFKGFKVGKTTKIYPNDDYSNTFLKVKLKTRQARFPSNIKVNIKKKKSGGYVDIIYPDEPNLARLKNNDEIQGLITRDISSLMESENIEDIVDDAGNLLENANIAMQSLNAIFVEIRGVISDNRSSINKVVKNLAKSTENLEKMSSYLENSFSGDEINVSMTNIKETTNNVKQITQQIDKTTLPIVNSALCETYSTVKNAKEITNGVKNTLKKKMGFSRLFFGRPISKDCD